MPVPCVTATGSFETGNRFSNSGLTELRCYGNRLFVYHNGDYALTISTASGKVVGRFSAHGDESFLLDYGAGVYLANVSTRNGVSARMFSVY